MTIKSQGSINCPHKVNEEVASSNSHVTRKAVSAPAVLSVEGLSSLVARKRFLPTEYSALSLIDNCRKRWMAFKGFVSILVIRLIMILGIFGGIRKISRCEGKSRIGNSMECAPRESLGNVRILSLFSNFLKYLSTILRFRKELWNNMIGNLVCKRNKRGTRKRKRIWSFASRPTLELRNLRLGNAVQETFRLRSGNTVETFMDTKHFPIRLCLFLDLCASCRGQLGLFKENLKIRIRVKAIYVNIYLFIYVFCYALLSCKLAAYPGAFAIKMYTLVYFSPKVNLLERKYHHKNQSINLIGLAHVGKAYSRNRLFLRPNRPCWKELRPLVTPWVRSIKEGTDPWRNQIWALLSQCPAPALRTQCLGGQVARFSRPFEARPTDPVRRELYRQLAEKPSTAATSGWCAPSRALASTPPPLGPGTEECAGRTLPTKKRKRRTSNRQPSASGH